MPDSDMVGWLGKIIDAARPVPTAADIESYISGSCRESFGDNVA
jgi:hypothetical protein